jgi:hypothetical protein
MKHLVYNRKMTAIVEVDRHMASVITSRYAIDIGWSKSGVTPGGGGSNPIICSDLVVREGCMIYLIEWYKDTDLREVGAREKKGWQENIQLR